MTYSTPAREIQEAGGLQKWMAKAAQAPARQPHSAAYPGPVTKSPANVPAAKGRKPSDLILGYDADRMNGLEARYAGRLEAMKRAGKIVFWKFEAVTLRIADRTTYTPDFFIMLPDGSLGFHETKGHWREDARVKIKTVAEQFPWFFFVGVEWDAKVTKEWKFERFRSKKSPAGAGQR